MRNMMMEKSELDFEAPLAQFEENDDYSLALESAKCRKDCENYNLVSQKDDNAAYHTVDRNSNPINSNELDEKVDNCDKDTFIENISGSLEDLVNTFDEKITKCFGNYDESVENIAPVQVRSQEEVMDDCQMWWTITGNFGNILPIDWSKSYTRKMHLPSVKNANVSNDVNIQKDSSFESINSEGEEENIANDLDMHTLILNGLQNEFESEPIKTAEEVLQEIDDIMLEDTLSDVSPINEIYEKGRDILRCPFKNEKLQSLSLVELNSTLMELEILIKEFSETLIAELALRDELEYEKELKNSFISLLLAVQSKRRQYFVEKKRQTKNGSSSTANNDKLPIKNESKYLTTVIPYKLENGPPNNQGLQVLIKSNYYSNWIISKLRKSSNLFELIGQKTVQ